MCVNFFLYLLKTRILPQLFFVYIPKLLLVYDLALTIVKLAD